MVFQVRNKQRVTSVDWGVAQAPPFSPLPESVVIVVMHNRGKPGIGSPAPYALLYNETGAGNSSMNAIIGTGASGNVPSFSYNGVDTTWWEIEDGDIDGVTTISVPTPAFGTNTPVGPLAPSNVGGPMIAIASLFGAQGDPANGCYWNDKAGWTKEFCFVYDDAGLHPWWADYTQAYDVAPAEVSETFVNTVGQSTLSGLILIPQIGGGSGGPIRLSNRADAEARRLTSDGTVAGQRVNHKPDSTAIRLTHDPEVEPIRITNR